MSNLAQIFLGLLSLFSFLFVYWKSLHDDFEPDVIFRSGFLMIAGFGLGLLLFSNIVPKIFPSSIVFLYTGLWFWGAVTGVFLTFVASVKIFRLPLYETIDSVALAFFISSIFVTKEVVYPVIAIVAFYYFKSHYKGFRWYKSGKIGFAGLSSLAIFFLTRSCIALLGLPVLAFTGIGKVEVVAGAAISFLLFFTVYNLGEK